MANETVFIRQAKLVVQVPVTCSNCGATQPSLNTPFMVENVGPGELLDRISSLRPTGSMLPVGWASYYGSPKDKFKCPDCVT